MLYVFLTWLAKRIACLFLVLVLSCNKCVLASTEVKKTTRTDFLHGLIVIIQ